MNTLDFNINDHVLVKLTPHGRKLHKEAHNELKARFPHVEILQEYQPVKEWADGWSRWQLWELMHLFGKHCYNGCNPPFETSIKIDMDKE